MSIIKSLAALALAVAPSHDAQQGVALVQAKPVDCSDAAAEILAKTGARLLSIRPHDDRCIIVVLIVKDGERPKKMTFRVPLVVPVEANSRL